MRSQKRGPRKSEALVGKRRSAAKSEAVRKARRTKSGSDDVVGVGVPDDPRVRICTAASRLHLITAYGGASPQGEAFGTCRRGWFKGEGALSVAFGDSSPKGGAKGTPRKRSFRGEEEQQREKRRRAACGAPSQKRLLRRSAAKSEAVRKARRTKSGSDDDVGVGVPDDPPRFDLVRPRNAGIGSVKKLRVTFRIQICRSAR